ncbi:PG0541 family transporter-associated protein [Parabacteroides pacaensis]|uniref:PG0541 family transporter-associated protein n=1 Tax=Parabacteroides pacaensis TaxID=2086575 RepID=UPI000D114470|nr:PG0541 family transporter-associated protein [Parabacteroides pacaensis]
MKAVFISFNQAYYEMIIELLDHNNIRGFTYWPEVQGRGSVNGEPRYGSHAWPALNSSIVTIIEEEKVDILLDLLHKMDKQTEALGLRAFVWNVEKSI